MVQKGLWFNIHAGTTKTNPDAVIGSDHDMVISNFNLKLKKVKTHSNIRRKCNVDKLKTLTTSIAFQVTVSGYFATLLDKGVTLK